MTPETTAGTGDWRADPDSELSSQLRAKIVDAARDCVMQSGHEKLRMDSVAKAANCSRATIYRYFGSKEEILLQIAIENFQRINAEVDAEIDAIDDVRLKLATGLARSLAIAHSSDLTHLFTSEILNRALAEHSEGVTSLAASRMVPMLKAARKEGWVRADIDEEEAVSWVILASTGLLSVGWPIVAGRELDPDEQVRYICRYLFYPVLDMQDLLD